MQQNLLCNIQSLNDAVAQNNTQVICGFFESARNAISNGGTVCIFEDFLPLTYREELTFNNLNDFNIWTKQRFSMIDCG
jgi:hypothetical protein